MTDPSDPTPERPGTEEESTPSSDGQVSESSRLGDGAVSDGDSVHGSPSTESGRADTGAAGGDGVPPENRRDNDFEPRHRKPDAEVDDL
jgi:hypothetical protein